MCVCLQPAIYCAVTCLCCGWLERSVKCHIHTLPTHAENTAVMSFQLEERGYTLFRCVRVSCSGWMWLRHSSVRTAGLYYYTFNLLSSCTSNNRCGAAFVAVFSSLSSSVSMIHEQQCVCIFFIPLLCLSSFASLFSGILYFPWQKNTNLLDVGIRQWKLLRKIFKYLFPMTKTRQQSK